MLMEDFTYELRSARARNIRGFQWADSEAELSQASNCLVLWMTGSGALEMEPKAPFELLLIP